MAKISATTCPEISEREKRNRERARKLAACGMVLLENRGALPLPEGTKKIALFGNGARKTVKGGTGSGDVNSRFAVNIEEGLEAAGMTVTTKDWLNRYETMSKEAMQAHFAALKTQLAPDGHNAIELVFGQPFKEPPVCEVTKEDVEASDTDTAVFVITRNSGEGKDRAVQAGDYELYPQEKQALSFLEEHYQKLIVVLNVGGVMDTGFLRSLQGPGALLLMSQAGCMGGCALADVLTGRVTPSGRLTDTWAVRYEDYPSADTFGRRNGDLDDEYYREGIYVGYRYFDTFNVPVAYPFGYGLSYTSFSMEVSGARVEDGKIGLTVEVRNTGTAHSGAEVVQVFYSAPDGRLEKPWQELAAYGKTRVLAPGESQTLTVCWPIRQMASYDPERSAWVLEKGTYYLRVGSHSRRTHVAAALTLEKEIVTERLSGRLPLDCEMRELSARGIAPYSYEGEEVEKEQAMWLKADPEQILCETAVYQTDNPRLQAPEYPGMIRAEDVLAGRARVEDLAAQLSAEQLADLCVGTARGGMESSIVGAASAVCPGAAGDTTSALLDERGIVNLITADGPAGLRLSASFAADAQQNILPGTSSAAIAEMGMLFGEAEQSALPEGAATYYQYCTAIPIATLLAQTWDLQAVREAGDIVGEEMEEFGVTLWLAPGMNIHRNPLCGRNFEYYSEDPLVAGLCAAAITLGVQRHPGAGTTIKHFAFNNQEDNRMHVNSHIGERAIREIYLKGFEIAVKAAQPMAMMTSYNLGNGIHTANSYDLLTAIARNEWGFQGIVMTDWGTTISQGLSGQDAPKYGCSNAAGCIRAGNDLIMPGSEEDVKEILRSVEAVEGSVPYPLSLGDLQACAARILSLVLHSAAYEGCTAYQAGQKGLEAYVEVR